MKPRGGCQSSGKLVKVLLTLGLAIIMLGTVWSFTWAAQAGGDSPASAQEGWGVLDAASVGFTLTAKAEAPDGSVYDVSNPGDIVYNGDVLTYTISLCNENAVPIASVLVDDVLPENTLDNRTIACSDDCDMIGEGEYVPVPSGVTIWITITRQTRWTFASIGPGECVDMAVWGRVIGQSAGTWFGNTASTNVGGLDRYLSSEVGERPPSAGVGLPEFPSWLSDDFGGTIDQDWGDFDRDGDLDLVLGSSLGATVYVNEGGDLEAYWHAPYYTSEDDPRHAYGVRWADLDGDAEQRLELVVVGNSVDHALEGAGVNYIYAYNEAATQEEQRFTQTNVFTSSLQLVRVAPADYDGDGDIDLIASANAINAPCAVRLYRNDGTGNFIGEATRNVDGNVWYPCVSDATGEDATAALGPVDYDNDGDVDLAIGAFPSTLRLLINQRQGEVLTDTNPFTSTVVLETDLEYIPYGLAWGDYDLDGYLDLAAAYPLQRKVYVYHNEMGDLGQRVLVPVYTLRTVSFMEPLSVDWGDFDGDGWLDLAVADSRLAIFLYDQTDDEFVRADYLGRPASGGQVWSVRAVDLDNQGSLALVATNRDGFSRLFDAESSKLKSTMQQVELGQMESVAWGDWNGDGSVDLLFGSGSGASGARLYLNEEGTFPLHESLFAGFGPHAIAFGDITGDGELEIVVGKGSGLHIYDNDVPIGNPPVLFVSGDAISSLALGDFDDNEVLDVLVGRENGVIDLYLLSSSGGILSVFSLSNVVTGVGASVSDLAVGDYNGDHYLDFAAGFDGGGVHIYRNFGDSTFDLIWQSAGLPTRAVAWADYDGDNDPDLAVGNYGTDDYVWRNNSGAFSAVPIWTSTTTMTLTTSLAWGDWNNDGYPDLAVGKDGAPDVVYANLGSGADYLAMVQMWRSDESYATTDVAWGDRDGDGDLDLAISQGGIRGASGFYENTLAVPAHIAASEAEAGKLPAAPPYVYVDRPGDTCDAYLYSSSEILGNPGVAPLHVVTITYRLYDLQGDPVVSTGFEYSLDGEVWLPATPYPSSPPPITATNGVTGVFVWNAIADGAIGEYARFRVRVVTQEATGPLQRAVGVGVSPPFRVRAQNCVWPEVYLTATELSSPDPEQECYRFTVDYSANGQALFDWDLDGNGTYEIVGVNNAPRDQCYAKPLYYTSPAVRLRTLQCPGRPAFDRVLIGDSPPPPPDYDVYLPLVLGGGEVGILHDATTLSAPASSADKAWGGSVTSAAGGTAVDPGVTDHSTVRGSVGTTSKVTMFALGVNSQPAINSDGSRIAFWSTGEWTGQNPDGSIEIFVAAPGDLGRVTYAQVTSSTGSVLGGFSLSPSMDDAGERLVFFSDMDNGENGDRNFEIFMADISEVSSAGVSVTQVTHTPRGVNILPDISGDGTYIAFASDNDLTGDSVDQFPWGQLEIYRAEVVGKAITFQRVTTSTEEFAINDKPSISEDGRFIAFVSNQDVTGQHTNDDGNLEVFIAEVGPSGQVTYTQITDSAACVNDDPSINADGTSIAYLSDCIGGSYDVYLWRDGLDTLQITETDGDEDHPSISADGLRVAYIWDRRLYLYDVIEDEVIAPVASGPGSTGFNAYPVLSADGSNVAFNHDWDIYVARYPLADLALSKTVSNGSTDVAEIFTYTLTITNTGPSPAPGVVLTDVLPSGVEAAYSYAADQGDDSDLILDLHLDDNSFVDSSSYGNHASCPGGVDGNCPSIISGKVGQAARFNGSGEYDDFLRINPITSFPDAEITSMFWLRTSDTSRTGTPFSYAASGSWAG
ncbi:MAG: FG-GAP-like repeat-containing protein, partial [Anaerolineae bacterium]